MTSSINPGHKQQFRRDSYCFCILHPLVVYILFIKLYKITNVSIATVQLLLLMLTMNIIIHSGYTDMGYNLVVFNFASSIEYIVYISLTSIPP